VSLAARFLKLARDRAHKHGLYDSPGYWDERVEAGQGLAQCIWPSNVYNALWHARQMAIADAALDVRGQRVLDLGCGTGRACLHLARRGAQHVTGLDFAPRAVVAAREAAAAAGLPLDARVYDVLEPPPAELAGGFDQLLSVGCLGMACDSHEKLRQALTHAAAFVRPDGRLLFMEPLHRSRLLRRLLRISVEEWCEVAADVGLDHLRHGGMGFVPLRYALSHVDWPAPLARPLFAAGEALLDASPLLLRAADYKWLLFRRREVS